ncbi:MAG: DEAD/DEAH box helicase [Candidatus Binatia bacterium]|nr:DEAD/DEAH box helicase [Candidatus Binatia bacterium]
MAITYRYQTKPFAHQRKCFELSRDREYFAFLMEQGTGKTKVGIDTAAYLYEKNKIEAVVIVGPNEGDVPEVWVEQFATHFPKRNSYAIARARSNMMKARVRDLLKKICDPHAKVGLRVITINVEALRKGSPMFNLLLKFMRQFKTLFIIDESTRIKSASSSQTRGALKLAMNTDYRRIASGVPITNAPFDAYPQFLFLSPTILGFDFFTAFKAHYCQLLPPEHGLIRYTAEKMASRVRDPQRRAELVTKMRSIIQIPARDAAGQIIYRNHDELRKKIAAHSFRVLKEDCLDLPPKLYTKRYVDLTPKQQLIYDQVKKEVIAEFVADGELQYITSSLAITRLLRLQQVVCNHYSPDPDPDLPKQPPKRIEGITRSPKGKNVTFDNPRIQALLSWIEEDPDVKGIIWCRHHPEIREIGETLRMLYGDHKVLELHGKVKGGERAEVRHKFQDVKNPAQWLIGQVRSGIGIDLFEAHWEFYYSNDYSLENRLQSEDRVHRLGLKHKLTIVDVIARGTLDEKIVATLRAKKEISDLILGDNPRNWL